MNDRMSRERKGFRFKRPYTMEASDFPGPRHVCLDNQKQLLKRLKTRRISWLTGRAQDAHELIDEERKEGKSND